MHCSSVIIGALAAGALAYIPPSQLARRQSYSSQSTQLTFFGYPDNCDDTGCYTDQTAYDCTNPDGTDRGSKAGGDGSYNNPLTVAPAPSNSVFAECSIIYIPYLQKYGIADGSCYSCATDHIDIWVPSSCSDTPDNVCACEDSLTPDSYQTVYYGITSDPGSTFTVDTTPLYDSSSQSCTGATHSRKVKRDAAGELQSFHSSGDLIPKSLLRHRQSGACSENSCQCPTC